MRLTTIAKQIVCLGAALTVSLIFADGARADAAHRPSGQSWVHVSGTGTGTSTTVFDTKKVGSRTISHAASTVVFRGDISANGTEVYTLTSYASGAVQFHGYGIFAGTIGSRTGTFAYHFTGSGSGSPPSGRIIFDSGMDGLAGLRGSLHWQQGSGADFSYDGHVRFVRDDDDEDSAA